MVIRQNKRGVFFTFMVIVIISLLSVSYIVYSNMRDRESTHDRISTMNNYLVSIEKDLSRQVYISGFRAIFAAQAKITETGLFVTNINQSLNELFFNGTINSESQDIMIGASFPDILASISSNSDKVNAIANVSDVQLAINQLDPWNVHFLLVMNLKFSDKENLARWGKVEYIEAFVPINNFEDPFYALHTNNLVINNITQTPFATFGLSNLSAHAINSYYKASVTAPSFLDRLEGKTSPNPQGIESFVNLQELSSQGLAINEKSAIDYIYFSANNPSSQYISGMPSWFRIDSEHLDEYNLS